MTRRKKAICLLAMLLAAVLTACSPRPAIPEDAVTSPDGRLAVRSDVRENLEDEQGLFYSIYDVQLYDRKESAMICTFHIVGRDFRFLWSPDGRYIAATYSGRTWTEYSLLDVRSHAATQAPGISEVLDSFRGSGETLDYELNADRPDPIVEPLEWSPDGKKLLVSYQVRDSELITQSGLFVFNLEEGTFTDLQQLPPSENDHVDIQRPEGFTW